HLASTDPDGGAAPGVDDCVRLDVLGDLEGETQVGKLGICWLTLRYYLEVLVVGAAIIARLYQEAARQGANEQAPSSRIGERARGQKAEVLLLGEDFARSFAC